jgi:hypothetical protein
MENDVYKDVKRLMKPLKFIDTNHLEGEITDEEFVKKALNKVKRRDRLAKKEGYDWSRYGNDGFVVSYKRRYIYKGLRFYLMVLRYFVVERDDFGQVKGLADRTGHLNRIGKHATIDRYGTTEEVLEIVESLKNSTEKILYLDSLHGFQEDWNLYEQIEWILGEVVSQIKTIS